MLCEQMYNGIRRDMAEELLKILDAGGDAYSRLAKTIDFIKENK